jgi:DNA invertase Pin-like site-specific DNA recombinase
MSHRVIGFVRLSTEEQAREGKAGLLRQHEDIRVAASRFDLDVVRIVELIDVGGASVMEASEVQDMLADMALPGIAGVVCSHQDRLARPDQLGGLVVFDAFSRWGKLIWTPSQVVDLREDSGFMMTGFMAIMAGIERKQIIRRTQSAKELQRARGRHANAKICLPHGVDFDFATGKWTWVDPWANRMQRAYDALLGGQSVRSIAANIGYTARGLGIALRNPIWTGRRVYTHKRGDKYASKNGRQADRKKVLRPKPLEVKINIAPLVSLETWDRAQEILGNSSKTWNAARTLPSRFLVGGMVFCPCGEPLYTRGDTRPGKRDVYVCRSRQPKGPGCGARVIHREVLDATAQQVVSSVLLRPEVLSRLVAAGPSQRPSTNPPDTQRAQKELRKLEEQRARLVRMTVTGVCTETDAIIERKRIEEESAVWRKQLAVVEPAQANTDSLAENVAHLLAEFAFVPVEDQKRILHAVVPRIVADLSGISEIAIRLPATDVNPGTRTCRGSWRPPA